MNCYNCQNQLQAAGKFCPNCGTQIKCKNCGQLFEIRANACNECGTFIEKISSNTTQIMNTIEFSEEKNKRTFKANFTDTVGANISDAIRPLLGLGKPQTQNPIRNKSTTSNLFEAEDVTPETDSVPAIPLPVSPVSQFDSIFIDVGDKFSLVEPRMKAKSKLDYSRRLACIFLYYKNLKGMVKVPRNQLNNLLTSVSVYDGNTRSFIANEETLFKYSGDEIELRLPGIELAKQILIDIANPSIEDTWKVGTRKASTTKRKKGDSTDTLTIDAEQTDE